MTHQPLYASTLHNRTTSSSRLRFRLWQNSTKLHCHIQLLSYRFCSADSLESYVLQNAVDLVSAVALSLTVTFHLNPPIVVSISPCHRCSTRRPSPPCRTWGKRRSRRHRRVGSLRITTRRQKPPRCCQVRQPPLATMETTTVRSGGMVPMVQSRLSGQTVRARQPHPEQMCRLSKLPGRREHDGPR